MRERKEKEALDDSLVAASTQPHEQTGPKPYNKPCLPSPQAIVHKPSNNKTWCILARIYFEPQIADGFFPLFLLLRNSTPHKLDGRSRA